MDRDEVIKKLLKAGAESNTYNPNTLWTPLHWAARYGDSRGITLLLESKAKQYLPDKKGYYPIDYAGLFHHEEVVN
jgi:ankyrin repeat protein